MDGLLQIRYLGLQKERTNESVQAETSARDLKPPTENRNLPDGTKPSPRSKSRRGGRRRGREGAQRTESLRSMPPLTTSRPLRDTTVTFILPPAGSRGSEAERGERETSRTAAACGRCRGEKRRRNGEGVDGRRWRI